MNAEQLAEIEGWCELLYNKSSSAQLAEAQRRLVPLGESAEYIPQCQFIMEHSRNSYALLVGAQSLTRLLTTHWNSFTVSQRVDIRTWACSSVILLYIMQFTVMFDLMAWRIAARLYEIGGGCSRI